MPDFAEPAAAAPDPVAAAPEPAAAIPDPAASALAARVAEYRRGHIVVDYAKRGMPIPEIAARLEIPEEEARAKLRAALARALPETPEVFAALQMSRLNEALLVAYSAMGEMGLKAVDRVLRIVRALDRLHGAARLLAAAVVSDAAEPAAVAAFARRERVSRSQGGETPPFPGRAASRSSPPDHLGGDKRNQNAPQASEKAQNRSQTPERSPGGPVGALADLAAALSERGDKRADAREFMPAPNLAAIRGGGASVRAPAAAGA